MAKLTATFVMLAAFLLAAPVIESATSNGTQFFNAIGTADSGGGE